MRVKEFYSRRACGKKYEYSLRLNEGDKRPLLLATVIPVICDMLKQNKRTKELAHNLEVTIISNLVYNPDWYEMPGRNEVLMSDDLMTLKKVINYLWKFKVVESNIRCEKTIGDVALEENCHLVVENNGSLCAFIIKSGASDHSKGGRSYMTCTSTRLEAMVVKSALEEKYPGIKVGFIYLRTSADEDGNILPEMLVTDTKKSNVLFADYSAYREEGVWLDDAFDELFVNVMQEKVNRPCNDCKHARLCRLKSMENVGISDKGEKQYVMPSYTDEQMDVIRSTEGQLVCVAGPGSGKTATLIGRIKEISKIVPLEQVLAITYTKKAANELIQRCKSFCADGSMPYVSTINAFCFEILRANSDVIGRRFKALTGVDNLLLIENLLYSRSAIKGIKYGKKYGRYGTLKTVERKLQLYQALGREAFLKKEELGDDFVEFAETYLEAVKEGGYITFDEMITETISLFREYPEILEGYRNLYKYIMVDEFQDVNSANAELIYLLAGRNGNLCVVGDDDQAIYGFRGGDCRYMLEFVKQYPGAVFKVLTKNFRSTKAIVDLASDVVRGNERFEKHIEACRDLGVKPLIVNANTPEDLDSVVSELVSEGYKYNDIAVLSTQNAPLENLHEKMKCPTVLAKTFLIDSFEFVILSSVLKIYFENDTGDDVMIPLASAIDRESLDNLSGGSVYEAMRDGIYPELTHYAFYEVLDTENRAGKVLQLISKVLYVVEHSTIDTLVENFETVIAATPATRTIRDLIEERSIKDCAELCGYMSKMILMEDEARVDFEAADAVTLITTHESKGKEWACVVLQNLEAYKSEAECRRMLYVACTRAKDRLIMCHEARSRICIELGSENVEVAV